MTKRLSDEEMTPKGVPNSDRHNTETAVHQPTDEHQTEAAKQAAHQEVAKNGETGPDFRGKA